MVRKLVEKLGISTHASRPDQMPAGQAQVHAGRKDWGRALSGLVAREGSQRLKTLSPSWGKAAPPVENCWPRERRCTQPCPVGHITALLVTVLCEPTGQLLGALGCWCLPHPSTWGHWLWQCCARSWHGKTVACVCFITLNNSRPRGPIWPPRRR